MQNAFILEMVRDFSRCFDMKDMYHVICLFFIFKIHSLTICGGLSQFWGKTRLTDTSTHFTLVLVVESPDVLNNVYYI